MSQERTYRCRCGWDVAAGVSTCPNCHGVFATVAAMDEMADALFDQALQFCRQGNPMEAVLRLAAAVHHRPADAQAWTVMGKALAKMNPTAMARYCFDQALRRDPSDPAAAAAMAAVGGSVVSPGMFKRMS